ncbi:flagellin [Limnohabitans sp. G3-2]|uniref:flagellin N-terminal helical domain-containing protein n=1 Tax=Limnohabitans sp. G3-2 TaxID=1100711 RepID=UPI000C1E9730|nr:flagellin [Limnohabitans sp. G3-2]PIT74793.1 flagellin [Limnohabitans sp. G3-2]
MSVINTNVKSMIAQNAMTVNNRTLGKSMEQLSTGKRINSAGDDAAGLAIANRMTAQIKALDQSVRNANDGISMMQTAEGATKEITNMLQRMRELSVQASNDSYSSTDRTAIAAEVTQLTNEVTRIATNTQWNGMAILGGAAAYSSMTFQVGTEGDATSAITVGFSGMSAGALTIGGTNLSFTTSVQAQASIELLDTAITAVDTFRSGLGARINRLTSAADNLANVALNTSASRSQIEDTDYAKTTTDLAKSQIIQQAATAMLAQANQAPQSVLSLLK